MVTNLALGWPCPECGKAKASLMHFYKNEELEVIACLLHCLSCEHTWKQELPQE
jgi:DNA-directed RNA polymerase subunit M/transcription elongation factor TFIIS